MMETNETEVTQEKGRKREGKDNNMVRLNILIMDDTDDELNRICLKLGMTKTDAVSEAIWMWLNSLRARGI